MDFGGYIPALIDGSAAADGSAITNPAGYTHNESECDVQQVDYKIVDSITTTNNAVVTVMDYSWDKNGRPKYASLALYVEYSGSRWEYYTNVGPTLLATNVATSTLPPKTGWVDVASVNFSVDYASFWETSMELDENTYAQIDAHYTSSNGSLGLWVKKIGENVYRMSQYSLTKNWTPGEVERNESYFGGGGAALRDVNGDLITDVNGYVIFAA